MRDYVLVVPVLHAETKISEIAVNWVLIIKLFCPCLPVTNSVLHLILNERPRSSGTLWGGGLIKIILQALR